MSTKSQTPPDEAFAEVEKINIVDEGALRDITNIAPPSGEGFAAPEPAPEPKKLTKKQIREAEAAAAQKAKTQNKPADATNVNAANQYAADPAKVQQAAPTRVNLAAIIPGETALTVVDKLMSILMPLGCNAAIGTKLHPHDFKLTADEKGVLRPAVERAMQTINLNFENPWTALAVTALAIYSTKAAIHVKFDDITESRKEKKAAKVAEMKPTKARVVGATDDDAERKRQRNERDRLRRERERGGQPAARRGRPANNG